MASPDHDDEMCAAKALIIFTAILPLPSSSDDETKSIRQINPAPEDHQPLPFAPRLPYACDMCPASFDKHQSLGGHKTKHRPKSTAAVPSGTSDQFPYMHECSACHLRFSTGQALGGHKRKHFPGVIGRGSSGKKTSSPSGSAGGSSSSVSVEDRGRQGNARREPLDFDLNEPYTE